MFSSKNSDETWIVDVNYDETWGNNVEQRRSMDTYCETHRPERLKNTFKGWRSLITIGNTTQRIESIKHGQEKSQKLCGAC